MIEYTIRHDESCHSCRAEEVGLAEFDQRNIGEKHQKIALLCKLCATSYTGVMYQYHKPEHELMAVVCLVGNEIIKAINAQHRL